MPKKPQLYLIRSLIALVWFYFLTAVYKWKVKTRASEQFTVNWTEEITEKKKKKKKKREEKLFLGQEKREYILLWKNKISELYIEINIKIMFL